MSGVRKRERREGSSTQTRRLQVQPREEEPRADLSLSESSGRAQDRYMTKSAGATLLRCSQQPCRFAVPFEALREGFQRATPPVRTAS